MTTDNDIEEFFKEQNLKVIIAADAETVVHKKKGNDIIEEVPAGGVGIAFEEIAKAGHATYIARGKTNGDKLSTDKHGKIIIGDGDSAYTLKRLFFSDEEISHYYYGFSNQTLWPLCHAAFEKPQFQNLWYDDFAIVNKKFAQAIKEEIKGKTFVWVNDYQLVLVPKYLGKQKDTVVGMFWHIPWPTWEIFRILPQKKEILESMLCCDFIGFHRGYHMRNFLQTVRRELEARIDTETNKIYYNDHVTSVSNLPLGIDTQGLAGMIEKKEKKHILQKLFSPKISISPTEDLFKKYKVILGIDRLDYTKGLLLRLQALNMFFEKYPHYKEKVVYLGILAPSRQAILSYQKLEDDIILLAEDINKKYQTKSWKPIELIFAVFTRQQVINFYTNASVCLVTPLDDGMNLVSKEFIVATSFAENPGMLVLSQFAGSAIDLTSAVIVNPYDVDQVADAIKQALDMPKKEKLQRIQQMKQTLDEKNVFDWTRDFVKATLSAGEDNK